MLDEKIYQERIKRWIDRLSKEIYPKSEKMKVQYICHQNEPIKPSDFEQYTWQELAEKEEWGKTWSCSWFIFSGMVPESFHDLEVGAYIDIQGEACVFKNIGEQTANLADLNKPLTPYIGLTNKIDWDHKAGKYYVPLFTKALGGESVRLIAEGGANGLFGKDKDSYCLEKAEIVIFDRNKYILTTDLRALFSIYEGLPERSVRRRRILFGLNKAVNHYQQGKGIEKCLETCKELLSIPASSSSLNAWSIGHAHIDLAWLWPVRETKRKGSRTFSTVLRMMEEYPDYKFGASQAQLYQWIKENYPHLYFEITDKIKEEKWECQGATWVENDTNMPSGESLIRQFIYGKKFFKEEFQKDLRYLWLPDCFGFTGSLPQIMKHCQVDYFISQKLSWNETNSFPHHTFIWKGIDGTDIKTHFIPTNEYNFSNMPNQFILAENRFAQADIANDFLNLYGIGDGGGGPSRDHIEMAIRLKNTDGIPKVKLAFANDFLKTLDAVNTEEMPVWKGELYFELHRGTYTTQSKMKKLNRKLESRLQQLEFLSVLYSSDICAELESIWKDTLLNQFHDIIPGSSIGWVYKDAHLLSEQNLKKLDSLESNILTCSLGKEQGNFYHLINSQPWDRKEIVQIKMDKPVKAYNEEGQELPNCCQNHISYILINIPALGSRCVELKETKSECDCIVSDKDHSSFENPYLFVELDHEGCIARIYDKQEKREVLSGKANVLRLWEDEPNNWGAWDINHFYRETEPEQARLVSQKVVVNNAFIKTIEQEFSIGNSTITQQVSLTCTSKMISICNEVNWNEKHKMLRVCAEPDLTAMNVSSEIQFGLIDRPTHQNTSWDRAKFEVLAHKFIDISQPNYGFAVINDCKYGHSVINNSLEINLLRSPADVDPEADIAIHNFSFAYYPHAGNLTNSDVVQKAHLFNSPLIQHISQAKPEKAVTLDFSFNTKNIKIDTVKQAFIDKNAIVLRMYETVGSTDSIVFNFAKQEMTALLSDALEENLQALTISDQSLEISFKPFEIKTLILK